MGKRKKPTRTIKINHKYLKFDEDGTPYIIQGNKSYKAKQVEIDDEEYFVVKHMGLTTWVEIDYAEL
jgi:hypothetical protein